jgi:hypothetical protein
LKKIGSLPLKTMRDVLYTEFLLPFERELKGGEGFDKLYNNYDDGPRPAAKIVGGTYMFFFSHNPFSVAVGSYLWFDGVYDYFWRKFSDKSHGTLAMDILSLPVRGIRNLYERRKSRYSTGNI